jgi:hypothetical protein
LRKPAFSRYAPPAVGEAARICFFRLGRRSITLVLLFPERLSLSRDDSMKIMKLRTILAIAAAAVGLTLTAVADKYDDLVKKGFRWINTDGPYACPAKDDVERMLKDKNDTDQLHMVEQLRAYFLIRGVIVQVLQEDKASGMTQFSSAGLNGTFWTLSKFLSKRPIQNITGNIELPVNPASPTVNIPGGNQALPSLTATPGETATPSPSPTPSPTP